MIDYDSNLFKQDSKEIAKYFTRVVNNYSFDYKGLAEELKDNKEMKRLALFWLKKISSYEYMKYNTDGRNEISARRGQELSEVSFLKRKLEKLPEKAEVLGDKNDKLLKVVWCIEHDHRTLQQTFSKFIFYFILITSTEKQQEQLKSSLGEDFYRLPLI